MATLKQLQGALEIAAELGEALEWKIGALAAVESQLRDAQADRDQLRAKVARLQAEREGEIADIRRTQSELREQLVASKCSEPTVRIDELTARVRELEQERDRALAGRGQAIAANRTIADGYDELRRELEATKGELAAERKSHSATLAALQATGSARDQLKAELERRAEDNTHLRRELSNALDQLRGITDKLVDSQAARRQLSIDRDELHAGRDEARQERDELEQELAKSRQQVAQLGETKQSHLRTIAHLKSSLEQTKNDCDKLKTSLDEARRELDELRHYSLEKSKGEQA